MLSAELKGKFYRIIYDPLFLSIDCQTKGKPSSFLCALHPSSAERDRLALYTDYVRSGHDVRWLSSSTVRTIVCTGERMQELILKPVFKRPHLSQSMRRID